MGEADSAKQVDLLVRELVDQADCWLAKQLKRADDAQLVFSRGSSDEVGFRLSEPLRSAARESYRQRLEEIERLFSQATDLTSLRDDATRQSVLNSLKEGH